MSAIITPCPRCKRTYISGVVGTTPWPAHECPDSNPNCAKCHGTGSRLDVHAPLEKQWGACDCAPLEAA